MLLRADTLARIMAGEVDTAFRRQRRPTVRAGGTLRTASGVLDILAVDEVGPEQITPADAHRAGFGSVAEVLASLVPKEHARIYRVRLRPGGPDPRVALREDADLGEEALAALARRLDRWDASSPRGPWTRAFLALIEAHPHVRAPDLAASLGWETAPFKAHVRKLKGLGLTISHSPGYELSPRGRAALRALGVGAARPRAGQESIGQSPEPSPGP